MTPQLEVIKVWFESIKERMDEVIQAYIWPIIDEGKLTVDEASLIHGNLLWSGLTRTGLLKYETPVVGTRLSKAMDLFESLNPGLADIIERNIELEFKDFIDYLENNYPDNYIKYIKAASK